MISPNHCKFSCYCLCCLWPLFFSKLGIWVGTNALEGIKEGSHQPLRKSLYSNTGQTCWKVPKSYWETMTATDLETNNSKNKHVWCFMFCKLIDAFCSARTFVCYMKNHAHVIVLICVKADTVFPFPPLPPPPVMWAITLKRTKLFSCLLTIF